MTDDSSSPPSPVVPFLSMGKETFKVSLQHVFAANRIKLMEQLLLADGSQENANTALVYLVGGTAETRYDSDHEPLFRQESYFAWLVGVKEPDCALCLNLRDQTTTLFVPNLPPQYATIMGRIRTLEEWKELYQVDNAEYIETAEEYMLSLNPSKLLLMHGKNSDSGLFYEPPKMQHSQLQSLVDTTSLFPIFAECRVIKSLAELQLLQHITEITSNAHAYVMRHCKPEMMEYQLESLFRHYCYYNFGCRLVGYTSICGCGPNAAILHYGHAGEPNARQLRNGDVCLMDMGAEYVFYGSGVTCSYPANGQFTEKQQFIYNAVLEAQRAVYRMMCPGVSYVDCHKAAEKAILAALQEIGMVVIHDDKTLDELVEMRLGAVFMPHGLGHFIGIGKSTRARRNGAASATAHTCCWFLQTLTMLVVIWKAIPHASWNLVSSRFVRLAS